MVAQTRRGLRPNDLDDLAHAPLHRNLEGSGGKGVLTGAMVGRWKLDGVEGGGWRPTGDGVGGEVLRLQGKEGDMRRGFRRSVGDEKHDGEELTVGGIWRGRDPSQGSEEASSSCNDKGKRIVRPRWCPEREESTKGGTRQRLAGGECRAVKYLGGREKAKRGEGSFGRPGLL
jgi:hypothetical protein